MKVFVSEPYNELFKIEGFKLDQNVKSIELCCGDEEENISDLKQLLTNNDIKNTLIKIQNKAFDQEEGWDEVLGIQFSGISFDGDFSEPKTVYVQVSGDGGLYVVESLDLFSEGYQTEEDWDVENWNQI